MLSPCFVVAIAGALFFVSTSASSRCVCSLQAFFYHSSCAEPGIMATVEIVREGHPDPSQFDKKSKYYDAKATEDEPRWFQVDVQLVRPDNDKRMRRKEAFRTGKGGGRASGTRRATGIDARLMPCGRRHRGRGFKSIPCDASCIRRFASSFISYSSSPPPHFCLLSKKRTFKQPILLHALRRFQTKELANMLLLSKTRLSVQPVAKDEWDFIVGIADKAEGKTA